MKITYGGRQFNSLEELNEHFINHGLTDFDEVNGLVWEEIRTATFKCYKYGPCHVHYIYLSLFRVTDYKSELYVVKRRDLNPCTDHDSIYTYGSEESIFNEAVSDFEKEGFELIEVHEYEE